MISLAAVQFDPQGTIDINELPSTEVDTLSRRVSRVPTLDQGVSPNDGGYSDGDRQFIVRWRSTRAMDARAKQLIRLHGRLRISTREGVFLALPQRFETRATESSLTLLVIERTDQ